MYIRSVRAHHKLHGGENPLKKTNFKQQRQQNAFAGREEFASETDVNQVRQQNQQAEAKKQQASGQRANRYEGGTK